MIFASVLYNRQSKLWNFIFVLDRQAGKQGRLKIGSGVASNSDNH